MLIVHHKVWGSTDIKNRDDYLLEFGSTTNIDIGNRGKEPTFVTGRRDVLDITLDNPLLSPKIKNWHFSNDASFSDHRYILCELAASRENRIAVRVPKLTIMAVFQGHINSEVGELQPYIETVEELDAVSIHFHNLLHRAFEESCPVKVQQSSIKVPWCDDDLGKVDKT